ncbi:hypothetical protein M199_gp134 [Halogranum tailed virus 1]|uniref:Uncharacterized protein n=1 Tax=Halogranum tailed virus 1 TaxID=1273749 RepID=R4TLG5_9CAUD|nr:hypothetical protein M199_gp134 [Halogranum tailed virus 1]AGM11532.1 hypothetical protein HGTV1_235 [Halogranum tailed virus 1]
MTDVEQIAIDILNEMYEQAEPGLDFDDLRENPDEYPDDWYSRHYLSDEESERILEKHMEQYDLTESERSSLRWECILNKGPSNVPPEEKP